MSGGAIAAVVSMIIIVVLVGLVALGMAGCPQYNVWQKELSGKAKLKEAEWSKQIAIEEAKAENIAAVQKAEARITIAIAEATAEVERAKGVAGAIEEIGDSLKANHLYLTYLWVNGLHDGSSETIYIPTEANLPILEAGRMFPRQAIKEGAN